MVLDRDTVRVELDDIGEGICGDYDPTDPTDISLLRFSVYHRENDEWVELDDASYCTQLPTDSEVHIQEQVCSIIMDEVHYPVTHGYRIKKLCERLSWIDETWS